MVGRKYVFSVCIGMWLPMTADQYFVLGCFKSNDHIKFCVGDVVQAQHTHLITIAKSQQRTVTASSLLSVKFVADCQISDIFMVNLHCYSHGQLENDLFSEVCIYLKRLIALLFLHAVINRHSSLSLKKPFYVSYAQHEATKKEVEAAKGKSGQKAKTSEEHFQTMFMKKDDEIHRLRDDIKELKPIAEEYRVLFAEHKELKLRFEAIMATSQTVQHVVHEMQGEKAAVDSRLKELTLVVNQVTGENVTLNQQNAQLKQQIEVCVCMGI